MGRFVFAIACNGPKTSSSEQMKLHILTVLGLPVYIYILRCWVVLFHQTTNDIQGVAKKCLPKSFAFFFCLECQSEILLTYLVIIYAYNRFISIYFAISILKLSALEWCKLAIFACLKTASKSAFPGVWPYVLDDICEWLRICFQM